MPRGGWFVQNMEDHGASHETATKTVATAAAVGGGSAGAVELGVLGSALVSAQAAGGVGGWLATQAQKLVNWVQGASEAAPQATQTAQAPSLQIQFGNNANQVFHTFRHTDALGLARADVQSAVQTHLSGAYSQMVQGKPFNQMIEVSGQRLQYTAYLLKSGAINVGRIHEIP